MKKFYILLSRTNTFPAKVIRRITGATYSHTSFTIYPRTDHFYSYARRHVDLPMFAGFVSYNPATWCIWYEPDVLTLSYTF